MPFCINGSARAFGACGVGSIPAGAAIINNMPTIIKYRYYIDTSDHRYTIYAIFDDDTYTIVGGVGYDYQYNNTSKFKVGGLLTIEQYKKIAPENQAGECNSLEEVQRELFLLIL